MFVVWIAQLNILNDSNGQVKRRTSLGGLIENEAGHGAGKPATKIIEETADRRGLPCQSPRREDREIMMADPCRGEASWEAPPGLSQSHRVQATLTSMCLGLAFSFFGKWISSMPCLNSAFTLSASASSGSAKVRAKLP